jgi:hypothetical protein
MSLIRRFSQDWAKEKGYLWKSLKASKQWTVENLANRLKTYNPRSLNRTKKKILWKK